MTETKSVDRSGIREDNGTWRLLCARLRRDDRGNPESFVLLYSVKSVMHEEGYSDGVRARHQSRRAEPFLRRWQGAMTNWASRNCKTLKGSLSGRSRTFDRAPALKSMRVCVLVTPGSPARPQLSSSVYPALEPSPDNRAPFVSAP